MSVAEKLKALDEAMTDGPWRPRYRERGPAHIVAGVPGKERAEIAGYATSPADYTRENTEPLAALRNALPQIVAAIEAAQGCTDWHRPEGNFTRLSAALDELDRALS